jgi:hypothetical protein
MDWSWNLISATTQEIRHQMKGAAPEMVSLWMVRDTPFLAEHRQYGNAVPDLAE